MPARAQHGADAHRHPTAAKVPPPGAGRPRPPARWIAQRPPHCRQAVQVKGLPDAAARQHARHLCAASMPSPQRVYRMRHMRGPAVRAQ